MNNLLTIEQDFRTPMMQRLFREQGKYPPKHRPLASKRWPFERNPKWVKCYGGR